MKAGIIATLLLASLVVPTPTPVAGQEAETAPLRVHLDCGACTDSLPARGWLEWSDSAQADVMVRVAADSMQQRFTITLRARGNPAVEDTLHYTLHGDAEPVHDRLLGMVQLGLVRYAAATPLAARLSVAFDAVAPARPADAAAGRADGAPTGSPATAARPVVQAGSGNASGAAAGGSGTGQRQAREQRRWAAGVELGFSGSSGNSDFIALTSGVRVRHLQTNRFRLDWSANFRYGESNGAVAARHTQSKLDFDLGPEARVAPFISVSGERDPFRRIDLRGRGGTGVRLSLHRDAAGEASLRGGVLYTHERFLPEAGREPRSDGVWSFKLTGNRQLGSGIRIENASSFDPVVGDFGDYNLDVTSKMSTRITRRVALTLSHTYAYDSTPVQGVQPADQRFQTGLTLDF